MIYTDTEKQRLRALTKGITAKFYNKQVSDRYAGNQDFIEACTIHPFETVPEITAKQCLFYFVLENYTPQIQEKVHLRNKPKGKKSQLDYHPWATIHMRFAEKYVKDPITGEIKPSGQRQIHLSNIDLEKIDDEVLQSALNGATLKFGTSYTTYNFRNGKEIRIEHVDTREHGINLIEKLVPFTLSEYHQVGAVEDNILTVIPPKNTPHVLVHGMTAHVYRVSFHQRDGNKSIKLKHTLISNKSRKNK
jgi:hypothetical protein